MGPSVGLWVIPTRAPAESAGWAKTVKVRGEGRGPDFTILFVDVITFITFINAYSYFENFSLF